MSSHAMKDRQRHAPPRIHHRTQAWSALLPLLVGLTLAACGKPELDWNCTMNGFGQGTCSFTNTGGGKGAVCGTIHVESDLGGGTQSGKFCSGQVEPASTTSVEFSIPQVRETCDSPSQPWTEVCTFAFVPAE